MKYSTVRCQIYFYFQSKSRFHGIKRQPWSLWLLWILKYIKMHIFGLVFILYFLKPSAGKKILLMFIIVSNIYMPCISWVILCMLHPPLVTDWSGMTDVVCMCQLILLFVRIKIVVVIFCVWTSQPQNVLNLHF